MLPVINAKSPWYDKEGLRFSCTGCGACCTGSPGYVWVTPEEIQQIAAHLNLELQEFVDLYVRQIGDQYSLKEVGPQFDCVFLKGKGCSIYEVRPTQCRTFPFWPRLMKSREAWEEAAKMCEGIQL